VQSMNSLKFMIDANMPRLVMRNLNDLGYDTVDIRDIEKPGIDDDRIFELAQQEGRIILTRDQDFGNIILYPLGTHKGIIVLKTRARSSKEINDLIINFLAEVSEDEILGSLIILEESRYRIRRGSNL